MARRRQFNVFSLSFLDVMCCGFGATLLVYLVINHEAENHIQQVNSALVGQVEFLEREVREGEVNLAELRNTIADTDQRIVDARGRAEQLMAEIERLKQELATRDDDSLARVEHLNRLKADLRQLEEQNRRLHEDGEQKKGQQVRRVAGEGDRQYLTGLKLGGKRILILFDRSASMLDHSLVNVIRLRNMPLETQRRAPKWQRSLATVDWLSAQLPPTSEYQLYAFNTTAEPVLAGTAGKWLPVSDRKQLDSAIAALGALRPESGTSLANALAVAATLSPRPDNIYLITDGLPTQGARVSGQARVDGRDRLKLFNQALSSLPNGIPVNVILEPMEGDPMAASAFWRLAQSTRGAFLAPATDWP